MTDQKNTIEPDKRAMDIAIFATGAMSVEIVSVRMATWAFKEHTIKTNTGDEFKLVTGATGEYGLFSKDNLKEPLKKGQIRDVPARPEEVEIPFEAPSDDELIDPDVAFVVEIAVENKELFAESMGGISHLEIGPEDLLKHLFLVDGDRPAKGLSDVQCSETEVSDDTLTMKVKADLNDRDALIAEAKECYEGCWGDSDWEPRSASEAMYEVLLASNANPSPSDLGFAICEVSFKMDPEEPGDPAP